MNCRPPVRDLHILTGLDVGGTETMLARYLSASSRAASAAVLALSGDGPMRARFEAAGVPVHVLGMRSGRPDAMSAWRFLRLIRALNPRVVAGWLAHGMLAASLAQVAIGRVTPGLVWNVRQALYDLSGERAHTRLVVRTLARLSARPDAIVYNSTASRAQHEALGFAGMAATVIANGVDCDRFRPDPAARAAVRAEFAVPTNAPLVGHVARLHLQKDHASLLRAFAAVRERHPEARLLLVGGDDGPGGRGPFALGLEDQAAALGLGRAVIFAGPRDDVPRLCAAFDLAVNSSVTEAFPNAVVEAMAAAVPVVATEVGDSPIVVGNTGRLVPAGAPDALAVALSDLLALGPEAWTRLGAAARKRALTHYGLANMVAAMDRILAAATRD